MIQENYPNRAKKDNVLTTFHVKKYKNLTAYDRLHKLLRLASPRAITAIIA
jgi:hypothetical protein